MVAPTRKLVLASAIAIALPAAAAIACSSILGFKDLTLLDAGGVDATDEGADGADAADASDATNSDGPVEVGPVCVHAVPPGPPSMSDMPDGGDGGEPVLVFAMDSLDLAQDTNLHFLPDAQVGFDLDGVCTCFADADPPSCTGEMACDPSNGRDVAANFLLSVLALYDGHLSQQSLVNRLQSGQFTVLIVVHGYNGLANDQTVFVEFYASPGTVRDGFGNPIPPNFDGNDIWLVSPSTVLTAQDAGQYVSRYMDNFAYVNGHVLVAHLPLGFPLLIRPNTGGNDNPITFDLTALEMSATVGQNDAGLWTLKDGNVGARWPSDKALYDFRTLNDTQGNSICGDSGYFTTLLSTLCPAVDISSDPRSDNDGAACNAVSLGVGFTASPALLGDQLDVQPVNVNCPNGWAPKCP